MRIRGGSASEVASSRHGGAGSGGRAPEHPAPDEGMRTTPHDAPGVTGRGHRFVLVVDRDGVSITLPRGRRLALWIGSARRRYGLVEVFTARKEWR